MKKSVKIVDPKKISALAAKLKRQGKKIVTTNGAFDLFHVGHLRFLQNVKKYGDVLIVGLNTDASIRKRKGTSRPIIPLKHRMEILAALPFVDYITYFAEDTPSKLLSALRPHVHVKDNGYALNEIAERPLIESLGGKVVLIPYTKETSTTKIIERVRK